MDDSGKVPGALLQLAAIQSAASRDMLTIAPAWLRYIAAAICGLIFSVFAFREESALTIGERDVSTALAVGTQLTRSALIGIAGPVVVGLLASVAAVVTAAWWLPMGYPVVAAILVFVAILSVRSLQHRALFRRLYRTAGRYLPPARLVTLARSGFEDPPEGQEREVSILLVDIVGFTQFSNEPGRSALDVVRMTNEYFNLMQTAINRYDGCSDKFLGDALLAFWNGLSDEPDHAARALLTAHEITTAINGSVRLTGPRLTVRAVVCTGTVYVGDLGARERSDFTIIGPAVNETFRLLHVPDLYGLPLMMNGKTVEKLKETPAMEASARHITGHTIVRIDDVELRGFSGLRSVCAYVPVDDPGLSEFETARQLLDRQMTQDGLVHLGRVQSGVLARAAKALSVRYTPAS